MFLEQRDDFAGWRFAQDVVWEKHNGSSFHNDRFRRIHESALHFYRGQWGDLYRKVPTGKAHERKQKIKRGKTPHLGVIGSAGVIDGDRLMTSVIFAPSCHGDALNETQKPEAIIAPLLEYSVPEGGLVVDCFAGSGTVLAVARKMRRRAIGIELREEQCAAAAARLKQGDLLAGAA